MEDTTTGKNLSIDEKNNLVSNKISAQENSIPTKELWQMTKSEYESIYGKPKKSTTVTSRFSQHKSAVEIALNRGLSVPPEVLADYPSLKGL